MIPEAIIYTLSELHRKEYNNNTILINMKATATINVCSVEDIELKEEADLLVCQTENGTKWLSVHDIEYISI